MSKKTNKTGTFAGTPYDWRHPTAARFKSRVWNPDAPFITPKWYGWGYDFNFYVLFHPRQSRHNRRSQKTR